MARRKRGRLLQLEAEVEAKRVKRIVLVKGLYSKRGYIKRGGFFGMVPGDWLSCLSDFGDHLAEFKDFRMNLELFQ